jgi:precorrin-6B methylase 2
MIQKPFTYKHCFIEDIYGKILNYFWQHIDILYFKIDRLANIYELSAGEKYEQEFKIFGISNGKKILHIGCGQYPVTAITLARLYDAKIVAIDRDLKAIEFAKEVIRKKKLEEKISIEHGDGLNYPIEKFDVIILGGLIFPKKQILEHVLNTVKPDAKIIFRTSIISFKLIFEHMNIHQDFFSIKKIERTWSASGIFNSPFKFASLKWVSLCLIKKNNYNNYF